jgi:hypothetical protein
MTTLRALVVQSLQAQILLACGHEDPLWRSSRHCGLCPDFGVGFSLAVDKERVVGRYLPAMSFDVLVDVCSVLLDEADSRRDFSAAAALLQVCLPSHAAYVRSVACHVIVLFSVATLAHSLTHLHTPTSTSHAPPFSWSQLSAFIFRDHKLPTWSLPAHSRGDDPVPIVTPHHRRRPKSHFPLVNIASGEVDRYLQQYIAGKTMWKNLQFWEFYFVRVMALRPKLQGASSIAGAGAGTSSTTDVKPTLRRGPDGAHTEDIEEAVFQLVGASHTHAHTHTHTHTHARTRL